jgi:hypothetical protein
MYLKIEDKMKSYQEYLTEIVFKGPVENMEKDIQFLDSSRMSDLQNLLKSGRVNNESRYGGISSHNGGYGGREYIEFEYRGKRYEIIQVDK